MPTGYTSDLAQGEQSFEDFVWRAARGMGALVMMRDEPMDAPIPERFEPSDYNLRKLREARAEAVRLEALTEEQADEEARADYAAAIARYEQREADRLAQRNRYSAMLAQVVRWTPPTSDHKGFQEFMAQQLRDSIKFDCDYTAECPQALPGAVWRETRLAKERDSIAYHAKEHMAEVKRTDNRNRWLAALRKSIPPGAPSGVSCHKETKS